MMLTIGVTGNIGAGKTQICLIFEVLGIPVYYADIEARRLMREDEKLITSIRKLIGEKAYLGNGELDRKYIAAIVFNDKNKLEALNALVHPAVAKDFKKWATRQQAAYVIKEAALLIEAGSYKDLDRNILVVADEDVRLNRVVKRDNVNERDVLARMRNQMDQESKKEYVDHIVYNNPGQFLVKQVMQLHREFLDLQK